MWKNNVPEIYKNNEYNISIISRKIQYINLFNERNFYVNKNSVPKIDKNNEFNICSF